MVIVTCIDELNGRLHICYICRWKQTSAKWKPFLALKVKEGGKSFFWDTMDSFSSRQSRNVSLTILPSLSADDNSDDG